MKGSVARNVAIATFFVWFLLVISSQVLRGMPIVPPSVDPQTYWIIQTVIAVLLALLAAVLTKIGQILSGARK